MKWIDIPPVWLLVFLALAGVAQAAMPGLALHHAGVRMLGLGLGLVGLGLILSAIVTMSRAGTTVIPHEEPDALVTSGLFRISRNPIYLGDALILSGSVLYWGQPVLLVLVPIFMWVIALRFIRAEEARLRAAFGEKFDQWATKTRRWL